MNFTMPIYKVDKEAFPACDFYPEAQEWRESTTFLNDFMIAERFGLAAVKDTFKRAFASWKDNAKYICELAVVTNHLAWIASEKNDGRLCKFYSDSYYKCYDHIFSHDSDGNNASPFSDDERTMIFKVLD